MSALPPGSPEEGQRSPTLLGRLDDALYAVEAGLVTFAAAVMTITVSLDIVYRSFATDESKLASKLAGLLELFAGELSAATHETMNQVVAPALLLFLAFCTGWGFFVASRRRINAPRPLGLCVLSGIASVVICTVAVQVIVHSPSKYVCLALLVFAVLAYARRCLMTRSWLRLGTALAGAAPVGYGCLQLRQDYIWSQELSLILLAWLAFVGASMATAKNKHILIDALSRIVPGKMAPWARALGLATTTLFCLYVLALAITHVFGEFGDFHSGELRPSTGLPAWTITLSVVIAFGLMSLRFLGVAVDAFINPRVPERRLDH